MSDNIEVELKSGGAFLSSSEFVERLDTGENRVIMAEIGMDVLRDVIWSDVWSSDFFWPVWYSVNEAGRMMFLGLVNGNIPLFLDKSRSGYTVRAVREKRRG